MAACLCEHTAHFNHTERTPNGNPSHKYAASFNPTFIVIVKSRYGSFDVCRNCAKDCWQNEADPKK